LLHETLESHQIYTEDQFLNLAAEKEKILDGTLYVIPFKKFQFSQQLKMATANLQTGAEEEAEDGEENGKEPFLVDTFWEDYKNYDVPKFALVGAQLDENER
jgi:hypothetical protein